MVRPLGDESCYTASPTRVGRCIRSGLDIGIRIHGSLSVLVGSSPSAGSDGVDKPGIVI